MTRWMLLTAGLLAGPALAQDTPPVAAKRPHVVKAPFGAERQDPYYWLRDDTRKNPEMLAYLAAENAYADRQLKPVEALEAKLYQETVARIKQDDSTVPYRKNGWWYYTRFETGADYPIVARRKGTMDAPEEVLFDEPKLAAGHGFFQIGDWQISPDGTKVAWAEDLVGRRQYVLQVKDLATGQVAAETVGNVEPNLAWSGDNQSVFYVAKDPVTLRSNKVMRHRLAGGADATVYTEDDESFYTGVGTTSDEKYVCIGVQATTMTEQRCAPAAAPDTFTVISPRQRDILYDADHVGTRWIMRTNAAAKNYKLVQKADGAAAWTDLVPARATAFIQAFKPFDGFVAIEERVGGNKRMRVLKNDGSGAPVAADEPAYTMTLDENAESDTDWLRYTYTSLVTSITTYEVNAKTGERRLLKVKPVPGYDATKYETARVWAPARDGTKVPVTLFYAKGMKRDGTAPLLQYAYGAYGISSDPGFNVGYPSLADRGVVVAIAHIRGGQEMGRDWYDQGHLAKKINSFQDFIDVTRYLVAQKYAARGRVAAMGGSAGGLLMGGVANMAPADYRVIAAQVPFVDVLTTMLDKSIPLTTNEYDEWGNPEQKRWYDVMARYSPYDNVAAQDYPALYVGTGLWDSQVQYYEPTKWVAKLRATKTDANPLVFRINMEAGHGGKSGRFERYKQNAEAQAFMLGQLGVKE